MTKREQLIAWLGDAHAMEVGIVSTLEKHIADAKGQPKIKAALTAHLRETKKHAEVVKKALESLGGSHPVVREGLSKVASMMGGLGTSMASDTSVKNAIADFATEHFEIACYTSLVQTANELGETKIAASCKTILREEVAMAKTLKALFPEINAAYLATLDEDDSEAVKAASPRKPTTKKAAAKKTSAKRQQSN
jgi:ferritin-like metal-binding protein YciE